LEGSGRDTWECVWWWILYYGKVDYVIRLEKREKSFGGYVKWKAKQVSKIQEIKDVMEIWRLLWISQIFLKIQEYRTPYGGWSALKDTTQIYAVQYLISFVFFFFFFLSFSFIISLYHLKTIFFFLINALSSFVIKKTNWPTKR